MSKKSKEGIEIPEQVREFAENSMDQARKAFDDIIASTQEAVSSAEESSSSIQSSVMNFGKQALDYAEENMTSAFDFAQQIIRTTDPEEIMKLQTDYLKAQMSAYGEQARSMSESAASTADDLGKKSGDD